MTDSRNSEERSDALDILALLASRAVHGYGSQPLPNVVDERVTRLIRIWAAAEPSDRAVLEALAEGQPAQALLCYSERNATLAVREGSATRIVDALTAAGLAMQTGDVRAGLLVLAVVYDAACRVGADAAQLFERAAALVGAAAAGALRSFPHRAPADRGLAAMGYVALDDPFRYQREW